MTLSTRTRLIYIFAIKLWENLLNLPLKIHKLKSFFVDWKKSFSLLLFFLLSESKSFYSLWDGRVAVALCPAYAHFALCFGLDSFEFWINTLQLKINEKNNIWHTLKVGSIQECHTTHFDLSFEKKILKLTSTTKVDLLIDNFSC